MPGGNTRIGVLKEKLLEFVERIYNQADKFDLRIVVFNDTVKKVFHYN